ncbi:MAG: hypothetical protein JXR68_06790 [Bacteroidales bacterium]|nr:hypothetical protein [Bacteroidales bacterium]
MKLVKIYAISFIIASFSVIFNSCAPAYVPNVVNTPLFNNKAETQLGIYSGISGLDAQAAVAITNNIGVMFNSSFINSVSDTTDKYHKHTFFEAGIGYYTVFNKNGHFALFSGYGYGNVSIKATNIFGNLITTNATYQRIFIQPEFGFTSAIFELDFSPRFVFVDMNPDYLQFTTIKKVLVEPTITSKIGYKYLFFTSQIGFSMPLLNINSDVWFKRQAFIFSIGVQIKIVNKYHT